MARTREWLTGAVEVLVAVAVATGLLAALRHSAPVAGLEVLYIPAVLPIAIRRGQFLALLYAVLAFLTLNWFFIAPLHTLSIAHSQDLIPLVVLVICAAVVSRLAAAARRHANEAELARRTDELRTAILHSISHDLRTPLTAITAAGGALRRGGLEDADRVAAAEVIDVEGRRLAMLVDDLLDLSRIEAGATAPDPDWCDLGDVAAGAMAGLGQDAARVLLRIGPGLPLVQADGAQLERAVANLLSNALKHSPAGETVTLAVVASGGTVALEVINRGDDVPADERDHIFEPFFRGREHRGAGSGLGLAISRGFVEANGGTLTLRQSGGVTTFVIRLPVSRPHEVEG